MEGDGVAPDRDGGDAVCVRIARDQRRRPLWCHVVAPGNVGNHQGLTAVDAAERGEVTQAPVRGHLPDSTLARQASGQGRAFCCDGGVVHAPVARGDEQDEIGLSRVERRAQVPAGLLGWGAGVGEPGRRQVPLDTHTQGASPDDPHGGEDEDRPSASGSDLSKLPQVEHILRVSNSRYVVNVA